MVALVAFSGKLFNTEIQSLLILRCGSSCLCFFVFYPLNEKVQPFCTKSADRLHQMVQIGCTLSATLLHFSVQWVKKTVDNYVDNSFNAMLKTLD